MPNIILKNASGENVTYENVNVLGLRSTEGDTETFVSTNLIKTQIQADWNQTDETAVDYIKNKPQTFETEDELPKVTAEDDGKFLGVLNGIWQKVDAPNGGSSGVSSWNDLTDKPFYVEETQREELMPETALPFTLQQDMEDISAFMTTPTTEMLEMYNSEWSKALVLWDGIQYECEPKSYYGIKAIGNVGFMDGTGDSGEPFIVIVDDGTITGGSAQAAIVSVEDTLNGTATATHTVGILLVVEYVHSLDPKFIDDISWDKISDKPFYTIPAGTILANEEVIIQSTTLTPLTVDLTKLIAGAQYTVIINNDTYITEAVELDSNIIAIPISSAEGEDIFFYVSYYHGFFSDTFPAGETYHIQIICTEDTVHKIDSIYLPNTIGNGLPESTSSDSGKVLTVDSDGTANWSMPISDLPIVDSSDNNQILKVVNGVWTVADETKELPTVSSSNNGQILTVSNGTWAVTTPTTELPAVTPDNNNKILKVVDGVWDMADETVELPEVTTDDNNKVLKVVDGKWIAANEKEETIELPVVTNNDNGKFLRVINGAWAAYTIQNASEVQF